MLFSEKQYFAETWNLNYHIIDPEKVLTGG